MNSVRAGFNMELKEFWSNLWISILSAPIVWVITVFFSNSILGAVSAFSLDWYIQYWYLEIIAIVVGFGIQVWALIYVANTKFVMIISLVIFVALAGVYAYEQIFETGLPIKLWVLFFIFCVAAAQLAAICGYICIMVVLKVFSH